jgi:crotonobetainyl-CoA:carnitine CoA-transferase CaiB-like acyl-CoA transferase
MRFESLLVIETGPGMAGPLVTRTLRDFGARVIKIESRTRLEFGKTRVPPPGKTAGDVLEAPAVLEMSGGKESVTLNLKTAAGRQLFMSLIEQADVYVESYAPGWLERIGLSVEQFTKLNPRLIALSQSAFGGDGPKRDQRAYAPLMTAAAGVESTVGYADGRIVPQIASAVGDAVAAYFGNLLVLSALYKREKTGLGAMIDMSQTEASAAMAGIALTEYGLSGDDVRPRGNSDPRAAPHGIYPAAGDDAWVALTVRDDAQWDTLCTALNFDDQVRVRYATGQSRLASGGEIDALVATATKREKRDDLYIRLQAAGLSCSPVLDVYEADNFPALVERRLWSEFQHPRVGVVRMTEIPWRFDSVDLRRRAWAEPVGTSTDKVLRELLGASAGDIESWRQAGVLD